MKRGYSIVMLLVVCLAAAQLSAQSPAGGAGAGQKPPAAAPQAESNAFPEDTSKVPVLPSNNLSVPPGGSDSGSENGSDYGSAPLAGEERDPVRSPDDAAPQADSGEQQDWSSSLTGMDKLLPASDDDRQGKRKKKEAEIEPEHQETASEDIKVGNFYLDTKDWKGALSRFQSAMVLDPDEPEVYWGLAECERHLGDFADARAYYQKVVDYDPDSRHGKEARKALRDPEIANAKKAISGQTAGVTQK
jgi:hypothetical protein